MALRLCRLATRAMTSEPNKTGTQLNRVQRVRVQNARLDRARVGLEIDSVVTEGSLLWNASLVQLRSPTILPRGLVDGPPSLGDESYPSGVNLSKRLSDSLIIGSTLVGELVEATAGSVESR